MAKVYERVLASLFPEHCPRCGMVSEAGYCPACRADFVRVGAACPACGLVHGAARCPHRRARWRLDAVVAPLVYEPPLATELVALKRPRGRRLGRALGLLLAEACADAGAGARIELIVPVPLHAARLRERGFNQALEIARPVARRLGRPLAAHVARRARPTRLQPGLTSAERAANLVHAFGAARGPAARRIAIVDDVMTTGATANAVAAALRERGAVHVEAWAVARARPER